MIDAHPHRSYFLAYVALTEKGNESMAKITNRWLGSLRSPAADMVVFDDTLARFGVRVTPNRAISFIVQYRNAQGKSRRLTIGRYGQPWTLTEARKQAKKLLAAADGGGDPLQQRRDARVAQTFANFAETYIQRCKHGLIISRRSGKPKKPSTIETDEYRLQHLVGFFKDQPVREITPQDCRRCLDFLIRNKHGAARTFGLLGGILTEAVVQGERTGNPTHGIATPADGEREVRLTQEDYRTLDENLRAAELRGEHWQTIAAIRLLALTGCRKSEILGLRWTEVDFTGRALRLDDAKSKARVRPLGNLAMRELQQIRARPRDGGGDLVLPGPRKPGKPFNGLGARTEGAWLRIVGAEYSPHGLRHALGGVAGNLGYSEMVIGALLGNGKGGITQRYVKLDSILVSAADRVNAYIGAAWGISDADQSLVSAAA